MGVLTFSLVSPPCTASVSASPGCMESANLNYAVSKSSNNRVSTITVKRFSRRLILQFLGLNHMICYASSALAAPIMPDMKEPEVIRIQDFEASQWSEDSRRANGYFVYSTVDQFSGESKPVILPLDENQIIVGLKEVLTGMRVGGMFQDIVIGFLTNQYCLMIFLYMKEKSTDTTFGWIRK